MAQEIGTSAAQPRGSWKRKALIIGAPFVIVLGFFVLTQVIVALNKKPEEKRRPFNPLAVLAEYATQDDIQLVVETQGEARPRTEIDLVPEVGGKVVYVSPKFIEGGIFNKGDVLFRIDPADYNVAVIRAEASVARAKQVLVREQAEAEIARRDWEDLGRAGQPSDLTLRKPQMAEAQAGLQSAEADLQNAKIQLARTSVKAPFNGRVRTKTSDLGQFVSPGSRLGRVFSTDIIEVRLPLIDSDLAKVDIPIAYVAKDRDSAPDVTLSATVGGKIQTWPGKIMRTDSTYDTQTRALFAIAEVFDPYGSGASEAGVPLAPGLFVNANVKGLNHEDIVVISRDGLRPENKVFIAKDDGTGEIRTADVLDTTIDYAYIRGGVDAGELVILSPVEESRLVGPIKVVDYTDPSKVLVDPPKPQWLIDKEKAEDEAKSGDKKKKRRGKKDGDGDENSDNSDTADVAATDSSE